MSKRRTIKKESHNDTIITNNQTNQSEDMSFKYNKHSIISNKRNTGKDDILKLKPNKRCLYQDGDYFEIDKIVDHKTERGKLFYYIKWLDWSYNDNTWETPESIFNFNLILEYEEKYRKKSYTEGELEQREKRRIELQNFMEEKQSQENSKNTLIPKGNLTIDNPRKILQFIGDNLLLIQWIMRQKSGIKPRDSIVDYKRFKIKHPDILVEYYENCIFYKNY